MARKATTKCHKRTLILGMGNSILSDDAIGLIVAKKVYERLGTWNSKIGSVSLQLAETGGMNLLDIIQGYDRLIVIDSVKTGRFKPGEVIEIDAKGVIGSHRMLSSHDISLFEAIRLGNQLSVRMPETVKIYGIEIINNTDFGDKLTEELEEKLEGITDRIANRFC
jgi:hydrogenase maturation protease